MKAQKRLFSIMLALLAAVSLWACGNMPAGVPENEDAMQPEEDLGDIQKELESFVGEDAYEQNFEKPHVETNIYIDLTGYDVSDTKTAYFTAEKLSPDFTVHRAKDNEPVFHGRMREVARDPLTGKTVYKGDFSQVTEADVYYIQTAVIGRSYHFAVEKNHYEKQLQELTDRMLTQTDRDFFTDGKKDGARQGIMNLCRICAVSRIGGQKTDEKLLQAIGERAALLLGEYDSAKPSVRESYQTAAALSQASQMLAESDAALSSRCLKAAQEAYGQAEKTAGDKAGLPRCMAAAALYQAAGSAAYHTAVRDIFDGYENKIELYDEEEGFWAAYFYMTTERQVHVDTCEQLMNAFMMRCAGFLDQSAGGAYGLTRELTDGPEKEGLILTDALQLAIADYTLVSREYRAVSRQQIHYLMHDRDMDSLTDDEVAAMWLILKLSTR